MIGLGVKSGEPLMAFVVTLAIGAAIGLVNGWLTAYSRLQSFIVTLAMLTAVRGVALLLTQGYSNPIDVDWILAIGQGHFLGIFTSTWIAIIVAAAGWYVFSQTRYGRYVVAVGSNAESLRRSGINIRRVQLWTFIAASVSAAFAGIMIASRLASGSSNSGTGFELEVITAVVLGGTSLLGGHGSIDRHSVGCDDPRHHLERARPAPRRRLLGTNHPGHHPRGGHLPEQQAVRSHRERSPVTVVTTVTGRISSAEIGICLSHEHILNDVTSWWHPTSSVGLDPEEFARKKVGIEVVWDLKHDPFGNLDNCRLEDVETAIEEVARYAALGGRTIVEATGMSIGRDLAGLRTVSERTGVQIVAGTGFYLEASQPPNIASSSVEQLAGLMLVDIQEGEQGFAPGSSARSA